MDADYEFKKGQIAIVTEGEYSDYQIINSYKFLKDFDYGKYLVENCAPKQWENITSLLDFKLDADETLKYLLDNGIIELCEQAKMYLGAFGKITVYKEEFDEIVERLKGNE
jgi:hypothetical protein